MIAPDCRSTPYLSVQSDRTLMLTITPEDLSVCRECPHLHVRVLLDATPANLRQLAEAIDAWADSLEAIR